MPPAACDLLRQFIQLLLIARRQRDARALTGQRQCTSVTDALRRPRDQRDPPFEFHEHSFVRRQNYKVCGQEIAVNSQPTEAAMAAL